MFADVSERTVTGPSLSLVKFKLKTMGVDAEKCVVGENRLICPMVGLFPLLYLICFV